MKKKVNLFRRLLLLCVFALMLAIPLIPQTANAAGEQTIYWGYANNTLTLSDEPVLATDSGSFSASTCFTVVGYERPDSNPRPWDRYYDNIRTVIIQGNLQPVYTNYWFATLERLSYVDLSNIDFSNCVSMKGMFAGCGKSANSFSVKFSESTNTSNCKNMDSLFADCDRFHPDNSIYYLDTDSCESMKSMFLWCQQMPNIDLSKFNLSKCKDMSNMFECCYNLASVNLANCNLSACTNMSNMFLTCTDLATLDLSTADISACTNFTDMLKGCSSLTKISVGNKYQTAGITFPTKSGYVWMNEDTEVCYSGGTTIPSGSGSYVLTDSLPSGYSAYWALTANEQNDLKYDLVISPEPVDGDINGVFNTLADPRPWESKVSKEKILSVTFQKGAEGAMVKYNSLSGLFQNYSALKTVDFTGLDASGCTGADNLFYYCTKLEAVSLKDLDLSSVTTMKKMFYACSSLKLIDLTFINTDHVRDMTEMLVSCSPDFIIVGPSWKRGVLNSSVLPKFPLKMSRIDGGFRGVASNPLDGYISNESPGINIYVKDNSTDDEYMARYYRIKPLIVVLKQINALPGIEDPREKKNAAVAAQEALDALSDDMKALVPDEALAKLQDALDTEVPPQVTIRWSSIDGEDLIEPIAFDIPEDGISIFNFLRDNYNALCAHFARDGYAPFGYFLYSVGYDPMSNYTASTAQVFYGNDNIPGRTGNLTMTEDTELYFYSYKTIEGIEVTVNPPLCGRVLNKDGNGRPWPDVDSGEEVTVSGAGADKISTDNGKVTGYWKSAPDATDYYYGEIKGGTDYYLAVGGGPSNPELGYSGLSTNVFGYGVKGMDLTVNGGELVKSDGSDQLMSIVVKVTAVHDPDENGICKVCGEKVSDPGMGTDGTPVGPGASAEAADQAITSMTSDTDPAGSVFSKLAFKSKKQAKNSITLSWNKAGGAKSFVIYGNKCGKGIKPVKIATSSGTALAVKAISGKKLAKGTYYKFIIVALDGNNKVVSTSKLIHVATSGGKVGNHKKVTVKKAVTKKAKKLKKGKSLKLKAKAVKKSKKVKKHVGVRYESTNTQIATVSAKGVVKANNKGTCYVYAYAQNGVFKKVKVTVK